LPQLALALNCACAAAAEPDQEGLELGGVQRTRVEALDPQFRAGFSNSDQVVELQTSVTLDWRRAAWHVAGELMDARSLGNDDGSFVSGALVNTFEPIQAYVAWQHNASTFRIGRVTQDLGKRRLIGRNRFRNSINTFTGVDWSWKGENGRAARAFYWRPMRILPNDFASLLDNRHDLDRGLRDAVITGAFYQFPTFVNRHRLESYVVDAKAEERTDRAVASDLVTIGARLFREPQAAEWNYEVETMLQRGYSGGVVGGTARGDLDHRASFVHLEIGYQFDAPGAPNLMLQYDRATGDEDPTDFASERFNTLFGPRRSDFGPTGIYGIANRSNIDSPGLRLTWRPVPRWQTMFAYRSLRLQEPRDGWIGSGWRDPSGSAGSSIGRHLEGSFTFDAIPDRLSFETGFGYLSAGRFAEQAAGAAFRGDPQYFYASLTTTF
jgi:hypothetical protein